MTFYHRLPEYLREFAAQELKKLLSNCQQREVIVHKVIRDANIISDKALKEVGKDAIDSTLFYAYYRGMIDVKTTKDREYARAMVAKYERGEAIK